MPKQIQVPVVYCILNINTGNKYVGSTGNKYSRKNQHFYLLRRGKHYSEPMQKDYDTFGESSMKFIVLEEVKTYDRLDLYKREQHWIDEYKPKYNKSMIAGDIFPKTMITPEWKEVVRKRMTGRKQSQEEKDKRAKSIHNFWKDKKKVISPEQREKLRQANLGENNPNWGLHRSPKTKAIMSKKMGDKYEYTFQSPSGKIIVFRNLSNPTTDDLPPYWVRRKLLRNEIVPSYAGWEFIKKEEK